MTPLLPPITVNGREIPAERIAAEAQMHPAPKGKPGLAWRAAARALVLRELMLAQARAAGLSPDPREVAPGRMETEDEALVRQILEARVTAPPPDEDDLCRLYAADPARYLSPPLWQVSHILVAAQRDDAEARAAARQKAEALAAVLAARPEGFGTLAGAQSDCPSRGNGGQLGQIGPGDTVAEFEAALATLDPGGITPAPVETRFGFHLIRLDARADRAILPFEAVADRLRLAAEKAAWVRAARAYAEALLEKAEVTGLAPARAQA